MSFDSLLTAQQKDIAQLAKDFAEKTVEPVAHLIETDKTQLKKTWQQLAQLGLAGLTFPEEFGGAGCDTLSYLLAVKEIAKVSASLAVTLSVHTTVGILPLYKFGSKQAQAQYLTQLVSGEKIAAFALTEADAGSDAASGQSKARYTDGNYALNGSKIFTTNAHIADYIVLTARTESEATNNSKAFSAFIIEKDSQGLSVLKGDEKLGIQGSDWGSLNFDDVVIPEQNLLGERGQGFKLFMHCLDEGRISIAAIGLGIAEASLEAAQKYATERTQFGKPLADFQATQFKLANMATEIAAAEHLIMQAALLKQAGVPFTQEAAQAKLYASEMAVRATNDALQIFGGYGYTKDFPIERYWRDARCLPIVEGTSEVQRLVIARHLS